MHVFRTRVKFTLINATNAIFEKQETFIKWNAFIYRTIKFSNPQAKLYIVVCVFY